jgi:ATP-dependent helicase/DNAse subunit B
VAVSDAAAELDGGKFGALLHETLSAFGLDLAGPKDSVQWEDIFDFLVQRLHELAERGFGKQHQRPAVRIQFEQARRRLRAFAVEQAKQRDQGWRIVYAEDVRAKPLTVEWNVNDEPITLFGRIDRIDRHESEKRFRILDYKTGDSRKRPDQTHRQKGDWVDLQLPLYRILWPATGVSPTDLPVELGYFNLPKDSDETAVALADWDDEAFVEAEERAAFVIRNLREQAFPGPVYPAPAFTDDFAAICLDNVRSRPDLAGDTAGGAA